MNQSFIWYKTFYDTMKELERSDEHLAFLYSKAVMEYGLTGTYDESNSLVNALMAQTVFSINKAEERYAKVKQEGKKGGRPEKFTREMILELQAQGLNKDQIIKRLGCSSRTYDRKMKGVD